MVAVTLLPRQSLPVESDSCVQCHTDMGDDLARPVEEMRGDAHYSHDFSCHDCHGGDPSSMDQEIAMDPQNGFVGKPEGEGRIAMCAKCHADPVSMKKYNPSLRVDQVELYWTSVHGKRLKEGDPKPATCSSCHGHHGVYPPNDTRSKVHPMHVPETCGKCHADSKYMEQYGIPTDQVEGYKMSVHGEKLIKDGDLSSPACNDCHGNHGAVPPGIKSIAYVCSQCHPIQQELFMGSPHGAALEEYGLPSCADCHSRHLIIKPTDDMLGVNAGAICTACHSDGDAGWAVGKLMKEHLERLKSDIKEASGLLDRAEDNGMPSVDARYELQQAESDLVQSRTLIHSFTLATVEVALTDGVKNAESAKEAALKFFSELKYRKAGLWIAWFFIALFIIGIYLKIRDLNKERGLY